ncbi:MAG: two-component sensor histidine kinase, partial [Desulfobacteraceae bacterium]|nr:two-component sensor histidine kinase [Desulfobacteraceae bacterium]
MVSFRSKAAQDLHRKLKWLIFFRGLFGAVLLGSIFLAIMRPDMELQLVGKALDYLLLISLALLVLSVVYVAVLPWIRRLMLFAYIQVGIDTFLVTVIIFVTGSFSSIFAFMYLVVIVYATMVTYRSGGMVIATLCCIQYGLM